VSRGWKVGIGLVAFVIALNVVLVLLHSLSGGTPGGPTSSSYATGADGAAAYAALLDRVGHRVDKLRRAPSDVTLDPSGTVVLLDPRQPLASGDAVALRGFVDAGGRLLIGGAAGSWLRRVVPEAPDWTVRRAERGALAPSRALARVGEIDARGYGSWQGGAALPLLGSRERALLSEALVGSGRVWLLADASPLQNRLLDHADNARLGLALAGPPSRRVTFLERYHGYGQSSGLAAIPDRWWIAFALLALAGVVLMVASGRRFGPPQASERALPPPRREYVESLGGVLARTRKHEDAIRPVRGRITRLVAERTGLDEPSPDALRAAAVRLGVAADEAEVLSRPAASDSDVVAIGRVLASLERESRP
jgi:hypothetical protein